LPPVKGAQKALRLSLPGAPETWHYIPGLPGLFHPVTPTPVESIGLADDEAKAFGDNESLHVELVDVTADEAKAANEALAAAGFEALSGVRSALPDRETSEERDRLLAGAASAKAVNPNQED